MLIYKRGVETQATQLCQDSQAGGQQISGLSPRGVRSAAAAQTAGHFSPESPTIWGWSDSACS